MKLLKQTNTNKSILMLVAPLLLTFTGCDKKEKPKETFKSYEYYLAHTQEMLVRSDECEKINYVMSEAENNDCHGAGDAKSIYDLEHDK